jgi:hypothetical protein
MQATHAAQAIFSARARAGDSVLRGPWRATVRVVGVLSGRLNRLRELYGGADTSPRATAMATACVRVLAPSFPVALRM